MKRYIVCDENNDYEYKKITDSNNLKKLLIDELEQYSMSSLEKEDIKYVFNVMKKLALLDYDINYIKEELSYCGWYVQDLTELQKDLSNFQAYKNGSGSPIIKRDCIEETLELIRKEME